MTVNTRVSPSRLIRLLAIAGLSALAVGACSTTDSASKSAADSSTAAEQNTDEAAPDEAGGEPGGETTSAEDNSPQGLITEAAQAARDDSNAEYEFRVGTATDPWVQATGVLDTAQDRVRIQFGGDKKASVDGDTDAWFEAIIDGSIAYVRIGGDGRWVRLDGSGLGISLADLRTRGASSPQALVRSLEGAHDDFEKVGTEEIRGERTTHYRGTLSAGRELAETLVDQAAKQADAADAADTDTTSTDRDEQVQRVADALKSGLTSDVWLDDSGRPRRIEQSLTWSTLLDALGADTSGGADAAAPEPPAKEGRVVVGIDLWNYGTAGAVTVPDDTVGLVDFLGDVLDDVLGNDGDDGSAGNNGSNGNDGSNGKDASNVTSEQP